MAEFENIVGGKDGEVDPLEVLETDSDEAKIGKYLAQIRRNAGKMAATIQEIIEIHDDKVSKPH